MSYFRNPFSADKKMRNRALIVSVENFLPGVDLSNRKGVEKDTRRLHRVLMKLGFSVDIQMDLDAGEIYKAFKAASETPVSEVFVAVVSSHGEEGVVFGSDGCPVKLSEIYSYFDGPSMEDKSKIFLIQACRGAALDEGVLVETDSSFLDEDDSMSELLSIPIESAVIYATSPGYGAFMHPLGSVLIQTLCDLLEKDGGPDLELTQLLTRLNSHVAYNFQTRGKKYGGKKQMPCFVTRFTRDVYPFRKAADEDLSLTFAATKLIDEPRRSRKRSNRD